jgi:hypothetical protein
MSTRSRVAITMSCGLALIAVAVIAILAQTPDRVIASNSVNGGAELGLFHEHTAICQAGERFPAGTTALRVSLAAVAHPGPSVSVSVLSEGRPVTTGRRGAGWVSASLTLPLRPALAAQTDGKFCLTRGPAGLPIELVGNMAPPAVAVTQNGTPLSGRLRVEYLGHGQKSWLSLAKHVARRVGLLHEPSGTWIVIPLILLMAAVVGLAGWLLLREQRYE